MAVTVTLVGIKSTFYYCKFKTLNNNNTKRLKVILIAYCIKDKIGQNTQNVFRPHFFLLKLHAIFFIYYEMKKIS